MTDDRVPPRDHNLPPTEQPLTMDPAALEALRAAIAEEYSDVLTTMNQRIKAFDALPLAIVSKEDAGKADDLFKMMRTAKKRADECRKAATDPYRTRESLINALFETPMSRLAELQKTIKARVQIFMDAKATRERLEREAAAAREREEVQRREQAAAAAEAEQRAERGQAAGRRRRDRGRYRTCSERLRS